MRDHFLVALGTVFQNGLYCIYGCMDVEDRLSIFHKSFTTNWQSQPTSSNTFTLHVHYYALSYLIYMTEMNLEAAMRTYVLTCIGKSMC